MIIGLNGPKGCGKDTAGQYLVDKYGFTRVSFADKLKWSASALFNIPTSFWDEQKNNREANVEIWVEDTLISNLTVREFLQRYGTEAHREIFGDDFWVDQAIGEDAAFGNIVITDARFPNELRRIQELGGFNVRILRNSLDQSDAHASEAEPPAELIHYLLNNYGTIEEYKHYIDVMMMSVQHHMRVYED